MRVLALAEWEELQAAAQRFSDVDYKFLRKPETGLVMLQGRMGGTGSPFNVGETTVTRCSITLGSNTEGHAYIMGRNVEHAKLAAICDALLQDETQHEAVFKSVVEPLRKNIAERSLTKRSNAGATKVNFFTMVRGDD
jgi:alpha-D-ribose 1-methylphosphonate 5-triphosphate synthase subunit PhnG